MSLQLPTIAYGRGNGKTISQQLCYDRKKHVEKYGSHDLIHWDQEGSLQFVTFRLADSMPNDVVDRIEEVRTDWITKHPYPWDRDTAIEYDRLFSDKVEQWLDNGHGNCILSTEEACRIVVGALKYFDGLKYDLYDYVVMPNHVHVILLPLGVPLREIMHTLKSFTSKAINRTLGRSGRVWARSCFDRLIRSVEDYDRIAIYIHQNYLQFNK